MIVVPTVKKQKDDGEITTSHIKSKDKSGTATELKIRKASKGLKLKPFQ